MFSASFDSKMGCLYSVFDVKKHGKPIWEVRTRNWKLCEGENRLSGLLEGEAVTRIEKEEMLQHSRKDDEHKDTGAPIPAYTWTFEPAVPACGRTFLVAEMLQHTGVQNRQSAEKTKQPRYFAAHMAPLQELSPT
ncbi:hypothetical protein GQ457_16G017280 [Hibiscus cannabinus]